MAATKTEEPPLPAYAQTVEEITRIYKYLPPRPSIQEVEAANSVIHTVETVQNLELEEITKQQPPQNVDRELFSVLQEIKKAMVSFKSYEQRKEAAQLVELDRIFQVFDGLIQKASSLVSGKEVFGFGGDETTLVIIQDENTVDSAKQEDVKSGDGLKGFYPSVTSSRIIASSSGEIEVEKLDLLQVAAVIEKSAKSRARILDLQGKLLDKVEWLPLSLGKLSTLAELHLAENRIMALPNAIGSLETLRKLDVHGNQLINRPSSFGELQNLTDLDLSANLLKSLPESFENLKKLTHLDLSSNRFSNLPGTVGNLISLQRLNVEINDLEELPHSIGLCE
ncbi:hypothetical protein OROMI_018605 [Orobanche minor]